uniref:ODAD1 central coiled coil region domain-containing protein n=1 Tax=Lotharella globosa TaxID=91324 RepID=A0A7S4DFE2_9EUKA
MEGKKKNKNEATQNNLRMQRQQIEKLTLGNDRLKEDLALETRQGRTSNTSSTSSRIDRLKDESDEFTRKTAVETKRKTELIGKIKELEKKLAEQREFMREQMAGFSNSRDYNLRIQREIRRNENRLDKARIKYNEAQAHNNELRKQIDNLRRARDTYDKEFKSLTKELRDRKEKVQSLLASSKKAYEERSEAQAKMQARKAEADEKQLQFKKNWEQMLKKMEEQYKEEEMDEGTNMLGSRRRTNVYETMAEEKDEQELQNELAEKGQMIEQNKAAIHVSQEEVKRFESAFDKIQKATGIEDIDELVEAFITAEDRNFNLFNEVNEYTTKIEKQQMLLDELKKERDRYKEVGAGIEMDKTRKNILAGLQKQHKQTADKASMMEKKYEDSLKLVSNMKNGIKEIFDMIDCEKMETAKELMAEGVTETNMAEFIAVIEEQTMEILEAYKVAQDMDDDEDEDIQPEHDEHHDAEGEGQKETKETEGEMPENKANEEEEEVFEVHSESKTQDSGKMEEEAPDAGEKPEADGEGAQGTTGGPADDGVQA